MELREYLATTVNKRTGRRVTMAEFGLRIQRAQSIVSRIVNKKHRPDPSTAVRIVIATGASVSLDDLYGTPRKYRADANRGTH